MNNAIIQIAAMLKQYMGLDIASVGSALIERAVRERMARLAQPEVYTYLYRLQSEVDELQELIELVVVPETWFFRDREAILAVARLAREKIVREPTARVRILSLPCSTGEEPYSIAMALIDAGVPPGQFQIDAVDICRRSLALAQRAVYGRNSFRGKQLDYRDRYFSAAAEMSTLAVLNEEVRTRVRFRYGNMLEADFMHGEASYDFIFCRNVLIYFDRDMQVQAVDMLEGLLDEHGCLFVGPAEAGLLLRAHLESIGTPLSFGFRRKTARPQTPAPVVAVALASPSLAQLSPRTFASTPAAPPARPVRAVVAPSPVNAVAAPALSDDFLTRARASADRGELVQAAAFCEQQLRHAGPNAEVYYLQGLISDAQKNGATALQLYRKAIYLQPDHREALLHLAALLAAQGDTDAALRLQQRAERTRLTAGDKEQSHA